MKEVVEDISDKLDVMTYTETRRKDGSLRVQFGFENCVSLTEQHGARDTDINFLMKKYAPDELALYIAARNSHRQMLPDHDYSTELSMQDAMNHVHISRQAFQNLPDDIRRRFGSHVEFLKFIDNPQNEEKMVRMGVLTQEMINTIKMRMSEKKVEPTKPIDDKGKPIT